MKYKVVRKKIGRSYYLYRFFMFSALYTVYFTALGQAPTSDIAGPTYNNVITTAVPFLLVEPDARGAGLGNSGVAISSDANAMFWNPARYGFIDNVGGLSLSGFSYGHLNSTSSMKDAYFLYGSGYIRLNTKVVLATTIRNQSFGETTFTDINGQNLSTYRPNDFAIDVAIAAKVSERTSLSIAGRFINSNLTSGQNVSGMETSSARAIAMDVSLYWEKKYSQLFTFSWGVNISNIGNKISYIKDNSNGDFLPTNFRVGARTSHTLNEKLKLSFHLEINKLLVPTPPIYARDSLGNKISIPGTDKFEIQAGMEPDVSVFKGMVQSWHDAPDGFSEELKEFNVKYGIEFLLNQKIFFRQGVSYQEKSKGNQYFTLGAGAIIGRFNLGVGYQRALSDSKVYFNNANALRFSLMFTFG